MFERLISKELKKWSSRQDRKPLILRGARQVGKTTLVQQFAKEFNLFINLNLEKNEHRLLFEKNYSINELVSAIFYLEGKPRNLKKTLLFIDEIQNSPEAISSLRYFYEEIPELYVIAAGSLLETLLSRRISFPVGRVEYLAIRPCAFVEFLAAINELESIKILQELPPPDFAHNKLLGLFKQFIVLGGMPEIIAEFAKNNDLVRVNQIMSGLLTSYMDDIEKYANSQSEVNYIRHILETGFAYAGQRIHFAGFGESNYKSREIGEAFRTLEKTFLLELIYPTTSFQLPAISDYKKAPKLQWLDVGLTIYKAGIQADVYLNNDISDVWNGSVIEQIVGQEIIASNTEVMYKRMFWVREAKNSNAELDYVINVDGKLIPIEVKSKQGSSLKSLHLFMDLAPHQTAVRVWTNPFLIDEITTPSGKNFKLINIPVYLSFYITEIVRKFG